jgi:hypothetical protein
MFSFLLGSPTSLNPQKSIGKFLHCSRNLPAHFWYVTGYDASGGVVEIAAGHIEIWLGRA